MKKHQKLRSKLKDKKAKSKQAKGTEVRNSMGIRASVY